MQHQHTALPHILSTLLLQVSETERSAEAASASGRSKRARHGSPSRSCAGQTGAEPQALDQLAAAAEKVQADQQPSVSGLKQPVPAAGVSAPGAAVQPATARPATAAARERAQKPASSADSSSAEDSASPSRSLKGTAVADALQAAAPADERSLSPAPEGLAAALQPGASAQQPGCEPLLLPSC